MSTLVITGINGFAGYYTALAAFKSGHKIIGVGREASISPLLIDVVQKYISCDLCDRDKVSSLDLSEASAIINLAGYAKVGVSETEREEYLRVNVTVHTNLAQLLLDTSANTRMISVSSGAVYSPAQDMPLIEQSQVHTPETANIYVASKLAMESALQVFIQKDLDIIIARPFNHTGPGQQPGFLIPDLAQKITNSSNGIPVETGNLATKRDYTHAEDVATAYVQLATATDLSSKVYNICSGKSVEGEYIFKLLKNVLGKPELDFKTNQSLVRSQDPIELYGSYQLLNKDTSWQPTKDIEEIISDFSNWLKEPN